jgi:hypothetical protein
MARIKYNGVLSWSLTKCAREYKELEKILLDFLPSVLNDIIYSYARERFFYITEKKRERSHHFYVNRLHGITNMYTFEEGLNVAPKKYYEEIMDYVNFYYMMARGFMICTIDQLIYHYKDERYVIYEVTLPDKTLPRHYCSDYGDCDDVVYGYMVNKMILSKSYDLSDKNSFIELFIPLPYWFGGKHKPYNGPKPYFV